MTFENLAIIPPILDALHGLGYSEPTPIQAQAIPILLQGKDLLGCAQTGTGKTCAFVVPILQLLNERIDLRQRGKKIKALILTPTRELAIQIDESVRDYGKNLPGLRHTVIFGGVKQGAQTAALHAGIDILTATPGRLLDLMQQGFVDLSHLDFFVLDEADRMLDMGFIHDVRKVIAKLPAKRQSLFFSATMPPEIVELSNKILDRPTKVSVTPPSTTAERVEQGIFFVDKNNKNALLIHLLRDPAISRVLVFSRTKHGANKIAKVLTRHGIGAEAIHGNKSQAARVAALEGFKSGRLRVLVATDIAARGIDIDELSHVVQFDLPNVPETYVHRIGRTGRAGASGIAWAFCDTEERAYLRDIQRLIRLDVPVIKDHPYPPGSKSALTDDMVAAEREVESARGGVSRGQGRGQQSQRRPSDAQPSRRPSEAPAAQRQQPSERQQPAPRNNGGQQPAAKSHPNGPRPEGDSRGGNRRNKNRRGRGANPGGQQGERNGANPQNHSAQQGRSQAPAVQKPGEERRSGSEGFRGGIQWD